MVNFCNDYVSQKQRPLSQVAGGWAGGPWVWAGWRSLVGPSCAAHADHLDYIKKVMELGAVGFGWGLRWCVQVRQDPAHML